MSGFRLQFSGEAKSVKSKNIGLKKALEFSLCSKNYSPAGTPDSWTWVTVTVMEPKDWLVDGIRDGVFVAGSGEFTLRSYSASTGEKRQNADVRCSGFDLNFARPPKAVPMAEADTVRVPPRSPGPAAGTPGEDEPPFMRLREFEL